MQVDEIAREFDAASAAFAALLDAGDDYRAIMEPLERAAAIQRVAIAALIEASAETPDDIATKVAILGRITAQQLWPGLAEALLGSIGRDATALARAG